MILLIIGAIIIAFLAVVGIATFYEEPSCTDSKQNQGEQEVDCGGPCAYLCTEQMQPPTVLFTKALPNGAGRTDVIASVENKNTAAAAKNVPYRITLYGPDRAFIQEVSGTVDLPPAASVPIYVPNITSGKQTVASAFLTIAPSAPQWFAPLAASRIVPLVSITALRGTTEMPRIEAVLENQSTATLYNVRTIIIVHDERGEVIAASQTIVPVLPAQGQATATFTWNNAFSDIPTAIEVVPVVPLP